MTAAYTDDDVQAAVMAAGDRDLCEHELAFVTDEKPVPSFVCDLCDIRAVLAAVAPAIAARALREFADNHVGAQTAARMQEDLHARADEIERTP